MFKKRAIIFLIFSFGLGILLGCTNQTTAPPAPTEAAGVASPATSTLSLETVPASETSEVNQEPTAEAAAPTTVVEPTALAIEAATSKPIPSTATGTTPSEAVVETTVPPTQPPVVCEGELAATISNAEGPYYKSGAPERTSLIEPDMAGTPLILTGQILTPACQPLAGALLDFWQTDAQGEYDNVGYTLRGKQVSDAQGWYRLETITPAQYPGRPPHIHVKVTTLDGSKLTTQIYFEDQPGNDSDGLIQPSLIVPLTTLAEGSQTATFNFILVAEPVAQIVPTLEEAPTLEEFPLPPGSRPHDVAPAVDGGVWYTGQGSGELGWLDPSSGETRQIALGAGSAPHGVIVGPDGAPWITDGGLNAIVRVDPLTSEVQYFPLPENTGYTNLNTATFDHNGVLWFTGQSGVYGRLDPAGGQVEVFAAPQGRGPYGIATSPDGAVYYASLAGSHIARLDLVSGQATLLEPPTPDQGARRVWPDSQGRVWVSEWNGAQLARYDPATEQWQEWRLPGDNPMPYAVYVDEQDMVWLSDFGANALVRFDPQQETFTVFTLPSPAANVRQILGRPGEVWGAESGTDKLVVIRTR